MVSFQQLWDAEPEGFAQAAQRWEAFGTALGKRHGELLRVITAVGAQWEGEARDAAIAHLTERADRVERDRGRVEQVGPVLAEHAGALAGAQQLLHRAVAMAEGTPITVDPDGSVRIEPRAADLALLADPAQMALLLARARTIADGISTALPAAPQSDEAPAGRLRDLAPERGGVALPGGAAAPRVPPPGTSPQRVNDWWDGLSPAEQAELIHSRPQAIGNLDGIPVAARDQANRIVLGSLPDASGRIAELQDLGNDRSEAQTTELQRLVGIETIRDRLDSSEPQRAYLVGFDPSGNGKAIVAVGDPDTADNVVTYVPGTGAGLRSVPTDLRRADLMVEVATRLDPGATTSAVMWIGYEAPEEVANIPGVNADLTDLPGSGDAMDSGYAERAGPALDSFQHGLRATHEGPPSHNTVIGHSYGSTVTGHGASGHGLPVDDVVFVGSPGVGVDHASELGLKQGQVWSSRADNDPIQYGYDVGDVMVNPNEPRVDLVHGRNPSAPDFGGRTFTSDPGTPIVEVERGPWYNPVFGTDVQFSLDAHSEYWEEGSASLKNMTAITTDNDDLVE